MCHIRPTRCNALISISLHDLGMVIMAFHESGIIVKVGLLGAEEVRSES